MIDISLHLIGAHYVVLNVNWKLHVNVAYASLINNNKFHFLFLPTFMGKLL